MKHLSERDLKWSRYFRKFVKKETDLLIQKDQENGK